MSSTNFERQVSVGDVLGDRYRVEKKIAKKDKCTYVVADTKNNDEMWVLDLDVWPIEWPGTILHYFLFKNSRKSIKMINYTSADRNQMREI